MTRVVLDLEPPHTAKMLVETLCVAEARIGDHPADADRRASFVGHLQHLIDAIEAADDKQYVVLDVEADLRLPKDEPAAYLRRHADQVLFPSNFVLRAVADKLDALTPPRSKWNREAVVKFAGGGVAVRGVSEWQGSDGAIYSDEHISARSDVAVLSDGDLHLGSPPRPEEPAGDWAVVEDESGDHVWTRHPDGRWLFVAERDPKGFLWAGLPDGIKILSPGVTS